MFIHRDRSPTRRHWYHRHRHTAIELCNPGVTHTISPFRNVNGVRFCSEIFLCHLQPIPTLDGSVRSAWLCVVFTLNRPFYPASSVHPVSTLIPYPREIHVLLLWSQTVRQKKPKNKKKCKLVGKASEMPAYEYATPQARPEEILRVTKKTIPGKKI